MSAFVPVHMRASLTRGLLAFAAAAMAVIAFFACVMIAIAGIRVYMVGSGMANAGEPIFLDELAMPLDESVHHVAIGTAVIALALGIRAWIHRKSLAHSGPEQKDLH